LSAFPLSHKFGTKLDHPPNLLDFNFGTKIGRGVKFGKPNLTPRKFGSNFAVGLSDYFGTKFGEAQVSRCLDIKIYFFCLGGYR
jgi:hypothetical protein